MGIEPLIEEFYNKASKVATAVGFDNPKGTSGKAYCDDLYDFVHSNVRDLKKFSEYPPEVQLWHDNYGLYRLGDGKRFLKPA